MRFFHSQTEGQTSPDMVALPTRKIENLTMTFQKRIKTELTSVCGCSMLPDDGGNHSVTCCDYYGNILWTFCNKSVLAGPNGISVDNDGNLFVAGVWTQNVVVISSDGQLYRQILSFEDGLDFPLVLHYDQPTNTLLVVSDSNQPWLYEVTDNK
ncbi:unnamed protein product [Mytilus coruscus]|uniref:Uncharacterized protein n=1 Tax=Mytilus coruscus TaxID=42192 RepID=A0A6J8C6H5_MYTCO|nr:unnamed protein product [Mytilus coruscus]